MTIKKVIEGLVESLPSEIEEMVIGRDDLELKRILEIDIRMKHDELALILENTGKKKKEDIITCERLRTEIDFEKVILNFIKFNSQV